MNIIADQASDGTLAYIQNAISSFIGGLKGYITIDIVPDKKPNQQYFKIKNEKGEKVKLPIYTGNDDISGEVRIEIKDAKKYEHLGVKCMLVGYLGTQYQT